jgi:5,10-methylene-tetrahydrofolate dehydrogenase/methenyl tetrahydrofolate cyclohydrolase
MMLLNANATVTICHSKTCDLQKVVLQADIVVGAVGKAEFIKGSWIKEGAVVVDAGYHPGNVGDVELSAVIEKCSAYTPVRGGVGPMTIVAIERILNENHYSYATANSRQLNGMSESQLRAYRLLIVPGGNFEQSGNRVMSSR